jgi:hypothetical protein
VCVCALVAGLTLLALAGRGGAIVMSHAEKSGASMSTCSLRVTSAVTACK